MPKVKSPLLLAMAAIWLVVGAVTMAGSGGGDWFWLRLVGGLAGAAVIMAMLLETRLVDAEEDVDWEHLTDSPSFPPISLAEKHLGFNRASGPPLEWPVLYAKAGGPPARWAELQVRDLDTGLLVSHVVEVDCVEGWCDRDLGRLAVEQVIDRGYGRFEIELLGER